MTAQLAQLVPVAGVVLGAVLFLGARARRLAASLRKPPAEGCGGGCGCASEE